MTFVLVKKLLYDIPGFFPKYVKRRKGEKKKRA